MKIRLARCGFSIEPETQFERDYLTDEYWNVGKVTLTGMLALDKDKEEAISLQIYDEEALNKENERILKTFNNKEKHVNREEVLDKRVEDLNFENRIDRGLRQVGIDTIRNILDHGAEEIYEYRNIGATSLAKIALKLDGLGIPDMLKEIEEDKHKSFSGVISTLRFWRKTKR